MERLNKRNKLRWIWKGSVTPVNKKNNLIGERWGSMPSVSLCENEKNNLNGKRWGSVFSVSLCENRGFTLIEVVVSITILAVVFLSLYQFFFKSYSYSNDIREKEVALLLARRQAEHTLAGIEAEYDSITFDTLDGTIYETILKTNEEIPPSCSIKVFVGNKKVFVIQMLKP